MDGQILTLILNGGAGGVLLAIVVMLLRGDLLTGREGKQFREQITELTRRLDEANRRNELLIATAAHGIQVIDQTRPLVAQATAIVAKQQP